MKSHHINQKISIQSSQKPTRPTSLSNLKPLIQFQAKWRCESLSDLAYICKAKPKMLQNIILSNIDYQKIQKHGIRKLRNIFISTKRASSLNIQNYNQFEANKNLNTLLSSNNRWKKLFFGCHNNEDENTPIKKTLRLSRCQNLSVVEIVFHSNRDNQHIFYHLSKQLRGLNKLKHLALDTGHCKWEEAAEKSQKNAALLKFKPPRSLSSFYVNFQEGSFTDKLLKTFTSNLQRCSLLKTLTLDFTEISENIQSSETLIWSSFFEKAQNIKTLNIIDKIDASQQLEGPQAFLQSFQLLKNLTALSLDFSFISPKNHPHPSLSFVSIASLSSLKSLSLNLSGFKFPSTENFLTLLANLYQLEKLNLTFHDCTNTNNNLLQSVSQALQNLSKLQILILQIANKEISHIGITALAQKLPTLPCLKELVLDFTHSILNFESINLLTKSIAFLPLTVLSLTLGPPSQSLPPPQKLDEKNPLVTALSGFKNLSGLCLDLSAFDLSAKKFISFWDTLKDLKHLSLLTLRFSKFSSENNLEELESFKSCLQEMRQLSSLRLFFQAEISHQELSYIASSLANLSSLEILGLQFMSADQLNNESFKQLELGLRNLCSLKKLELGFHRKMELDRWAILDLLEGLVVLKNMESLVFGYYGKSLPHELGFVLMELKNSKSLKKFTSCTVNDFAVF